MKKDKGFSLYHGTCFNPAGVQSAECYLSLKKGKRVCSMDVTAIPMVNGNLEIAPSGGTV